MGEQPAEVVSGTRRLGSVPPLDGLRGIAVLLVMLSHTIVLVPGRLAGGRYHDYVSGGLLGVDLFFVLSGFLITAILLGERATHGGVALGSFYARRALRLLPALYLFLLVSWLYATFVGFPTNPDLLPIQPGSVGSSIRWALIYASNWQVVYHLFSVSEGFGHLWSLAVEEQFYLVWPVLLIVLLRVCRDVRAVVAFLVVAIGLVALRRYVLWSEGMNPLFLYVRTDTRADSLLVGALLAVLWVRRRTPTRGLVPAAWIATAVLCLFVATAQLESAYLYVGGFTVFALATAALILATVETDWVGNRFLSVQPLRMVGRVSYGLYLWHLPIFFAVAREGQSWSPLVRVAVAFCLTAALTALSWELVERPALQLKRRFSRRELRSPVGVVDAHLQSSTEDQ